jgi:hypothetical protein
MTPLTQADKARLFERMRQEPSPTRRATRARAWLVLPAGVFVASALYFAFDGPEHGQGRPLWFYLAAATSWGAVAVLSMMGALGHERGASWRSRGALLAVALGTPAVLFGAMFAVAVIAPELTDLYADRTGFKCMGLTMAAAVFPLLALLRLRRQSDPVHPGATGAALGSACGASAGVMVELWCPVASPAHIAIGHVLPIVALSALGALFGARVLAVRRAPGR